MSELDEQLRQLALQAQQHPPKSPERKRCLEQLITSIKNSGQKIRLNCHGYQELYQEIYDVTEQKTFQYICEKIDNYNLEKGEVMAWFKFIFNNKIPQAIAELINPGNSRNWSNIPRFSLDDLNHTSSESIETQSNTEIFLSEQIIQTIREDPEKLFEGKKMPSNPKVDFKWLAIKRYEGYSWKEISQEVGSEVSAISNFYQRSLEHFKTTIQDYLKN